MAQELKSVSIAAPGFFGLNNQENGVGLDVSWASEAFNCVISKEGSIESRKGWLPDSDAITGLPRIVQIHEHINSDGSAELHSFTDDNKILKGYVATLADISPTVAPTAGNWKAVNFNNNSYAFQAGQDPLEYTGSGVYAKVSAGSGFLDSADAVIATMKPNECLAAFGRLWVADAPANKMKIWWSDALLGRQWTGGSSGSLDLRSVLTRGMDTVVALRAWNGNLVIFCKHNILIYSGAGVPSGMQLVEQIVGIGCIARDSIQEVGLDIVFLSDSGVRSLGRSIQEKSLPINDYSKNIRDQLRSYVNSADLSKVRSVYSEDNAFYLLTLPSPSYNTWMTYCFDMRRPLDDGTYRVTMWNNINPSALKVSINNNLYMGQKGYLGRYVGYLDNLATYNMTYYTTWIDFAVAQEKFSKMMPNYGSFLKFLKKLTVTLSTYTATTLTFKWYFDFSSTQFSNQITTVASSAVAEYGLDTSEFGITEYSLGVLTFRIECPLFGSGQMVRLGMESAINGSKVEIQRMDLLAKLGRMN
jgi:hypothetical protein